MLSSLPSSCRFPLSRVCQAVKAAAPLPFAGVSCEYLNAPAARRPSLAELTLLLNYSCLPTRRCTASQGLDSSSASEVMLLARKLAFPVDRRAVVASVHQPSPEMFALFDKVR